MQRRTRRIDNTRGDAHGSTFSVYRRVRVFDDPVACDLFLDSVALASGKLNFQVWAYALMPDHVHILVQPQAPKYDMAAILKQIKIDCSGKVFKRYPSLASQMTIHRRDGRSERHLWQPGGGYDRNYFTGRHTWRFIDYVHNNPVMEGLCLRPEDWPWSSARLYASGEMKSGLLTRCPWFAS